MAGQNSMKNKQVISWAMYDWANSAFATTIMAGFFPLFFKQYWSSGTDVTVSTFQLGTANSLASIIVAAMAPVLGAMADRGGAKKRFLLFFAIMGMVMTGALNFVAAGEWQIAIALYAAAFIGFAGGNIFYDALILDVSPANKLDMVSALGFALGYLGGGILFSLNVAMSLWPQFFGFADQAEAVRASFVSVAVWWAIFSVPLLLFVREAPPAKKIAGRNVIIAGFAQLRDTFRDIRHLKVVFLFLIAYWLYIDGVDTVIRMAVDYGMSLGLDSNDLIIALLITQFVGFPAALACGWLGDRMGAKTALLIGIGVYICVCVAAFFMRNESDFYMLAIVIGLVQGGVQALSRSLYARIIPGDKTAEFFGFYNMLGKFAAVLGPVLMGLVAVVSGDPRYGILAIIPLFIIGGVLLYCVNLEEAQRMAQN